MNTIRIRPITAADIDIVLDLQSASPGAAIWNRKTYEDICSGFGVGRCLLAEMGAPSERVFVGFASFRITDHEAELLNLAVRPEMRRKGIGSALLQAVIGECGRAGVGDLFLEVREGNAAALGIYDLFGFRRVGHRPGYYRSPPEDALVLRMQILS